MRYGDDVLEERRILAGAYNKLKSKKYVSFKINKKISDNAYVVDLPSDMVITSTKNMFNDS